MFHASGRFPANLCLDEEAAAMLDEQAGERGGGFGINTQNRGVYGNGSSGDRGIIGFGDSGGPSRFFYTAKASRSEREAGCEHLLARSGAEAVDREADTAGLDSPRAGAGRTASTIRNHHPTVKPLSLMRWLCRLVTPPGGLILDPFMGSGSTGCAAALEGFQFTGIDTEQEYCNIAEARIAHWFTQKGLPLG
jgi:site-specific DNA-methyltransferase (adenine-specific)